MSRTWFVQPETIRLPLFGDETTWIAVKKTLTAGDARTLAARSLKRMSSVNSATGETSVGWDVDLAAGAFEKVALYLVDWNLTDADGKTVAIDTPQTKHDALRALDPEVFTEIERAIDQHEAATREKKRTATATA